MKLSAEEIAQRRAKFFIESDEKKKLIEKAMSASADGDNDQWISLTQQLSDINPIECEHQRSWNKECEECDDIHIQCFPEYFVACMTCGKLVDIDEPDDNGKCFNCD